MIGNIVLVALAGSAVATIVLYLLVVTAWVLISDKRTGAEFE